MPNIPKPSVGDTTDTGHDRTVLSDGGQRRQSRSDSERASDAASDEAVEAAVEAVTGTEEPVGTPDLRTPGTDDSVAADEGGEAGTTDRDAGTTDAAETASGHDGQVVLRAEGVEKTYGSWLPFGRTVEVLDGADIEIRAGEVVGIVGENGSGKSTLLQALVGALEPDAGTVETSGRVGWCPQEELLYDRLTVRETFRLFGEGYGMDRSEIREARDRLAGTLDFERFLDYRVDQLSGGNRQKVNLSIALLHDPDVLLLDEPYTGFDWDTYLAFWELTGDLRERGTAVAIISHLINEQERFDRIVELADGTLEDVTDEGSNQAADAGVR
jgi:ABC-2 type transport system ATP-binding protein